MKLVDVRTLPFVDFNVNSLISMEQTWADGAKFVYNDSARPDHGFNLVTGGRIVYTDACGRVIEATKGCVTYLPKGQRYEAAFFGGKDSSVRCILINFALTDAGGRPLCLSEGITNFCSDREGTLLKDFRIISGTYKTSTDRLRIKTAFLDLLQKLIPAFEEIGGDFSVGQCAEYINRNYATRLSVPELAGMCRMSETTFRKRFKEMYGLTPTQYITKRKIHIACDMLRSSDITISEISDLLGFYDTAYFYKTMKHYTDSTPAEYRNGRRGEP